LILGIDHVVILVEDLDAAQADYARLGFTVVPGGAHAGGLTQNALIAFADGSYLELLAFTPPGGAGAPPAGLSALTRTWHGRARSGEGLLDFALLPEAIAADIAAAQARGLTLEGPLPGGRRRPDGQEVAWQLALPPAADLPFLCGDVTPRDLRVPPGPDRQQANGGQGVAGMFVASPDVATSRARYAALLGPAAPQTADGQGRPVFTVGGATITLLSPAQGDDPLGQQRAAGDARPYALWLRTDPGHSPGWLDRGRAHGAWIWMAATAPRWADAAQ